MPKDNNILHSLATTSLQDEVRGGQRADVASIVPTGSAKSLVSSKQVAFYIADMLESLEKLSVDNNLSVLGLMLAMAKDQADDDAGKSQSDRAHAVR